MKVKRIIKGFIYLFPIICVLVVALGTCFFRLNKNYVYLDKEVTSNNTTTYTYRNGIPDDLYSPIYNGMHQFSNFTGDINSNIKDNVYQLLYILSFNDDNEGTLFYFIQDFISYEIVAIMVCAVLDVIFLIPEFYNKLEDKYIKGGKKRE